MPRRKPASATTPAPAFEALEQRMLLSLTIDLDYSFDTQGFFDDSDRREVVEFAADYLGGLIDDSLLAIIPGAGNSWTARFNHPGTGELAEVNDPTIPADTIRIYIGGRDLGASQLGLGGAGGWRASGSTSFLQIVEGRGQSGAIGPEASRTDFAAWGGSVAFDIDANWHTGLSSSDLGAGEIDLLSLALHEFVHVLGFADSTPSFANLTSGTQFTGPQSLAVLNAPEFAFDGDTTGGPRWQRPQSLTELSATATSTPFQAITTTVGRTGAYHVLSDQTVGGSGAGAWDGVLLVYEGAFDPADPLANLIAINDDYGGALLGGAGPGYSGVENLRLVAGRSYIIVTTGFADSDAGAHRLEIRRPARDLLLDASDLSHWRNGTFSRGQEAAMDPTLTTGTRKLLTPLDFAALGDIGWEIAGPRWPGAGAAVTLDLATGDGSAVRAASDGHPGLHRFTPAAGGFFEVVADASAPVMMRLWDSAGRLVATSGATSPGASLVAHTAVETYTLEVVSTDSATYELRFATTPAGHRLYFPEGFATSRTIEAVWLTNSGPDAVTFTLTMRYEDPALPRDANTLASGRIIGPGEQMQVSISHLSDAFATDALTGDTILTDTPYALVLESSGYLAAAVERWDTFGGRLLSTTEDFTSTVDRTWTFAQVVKQPGTHDFLVFYNPHEHSAVVTITFFGGAGGGQVQMEQVLGPNRRGGLNLARESLVPAGVSGVVITSAPLLGAHEGAHRGIVAALSHFESGQVGWLVTGLAGDLPAAGLLAAPAPASEAELLIFNPGPAAAALEVEDPDGMVTMFGVGAGATLAQAAPAGEGLRYRFTTGDGAVQIVSREGDAASAGPASIGSRNHSFGLVDLTRSGLRGPAGEGAILVFNPGSALAEVRFRFLLPSGEEVTAMLNVGAGMFAVLRLHETPGLLGADGAFSAILRSTAPIAAAMSLFDTVGMVGWATAGAPAGVIEPLA